MGKKAKFLANVRKISVQAIIGNEQVPNPHNPATVINKPVSVFCTMDPTFETDDPVLINALKNHPLHNRVFSLMEESDIDVVGIQDVDPAAKDYVETVKKAKEYGLNFGEEGSFNELKAQVAKLEQQNKAVSEEQEKKSQKPIKGSDTMSEFINEMCSVSKADTVTLKEFYKVYKNWSYAKGYKPFTVLMISRILKRFPYLELRKNKDNSTYIVGLSLKEENTDG